MTPRLALLALLALSGCVLAPWSPPPRDADLDARDATDAADARDVTDARDAPDACPFGMTLCGGLCTNLQSDVTHCGSCALACALPHANAVCTRGACAVSVCEPTLGNCDGIDANGCETDLTTSASNCGACRTTCSSSGGAAMCTAGRCSTTCAPNLGDCDGSPANGCETSLTSTTNCGACAAACAPANAIATCSSGRCAIAACMAGYADCDGSVANGCEVNTRTDAANCGRCTNVCALPNATAACVSGSCAVASCSAGFGNCDGSPVNGCEANTNTSLAHCGMCGRACSVASATAVCVAGACTLGACNTNQGNCDGQVDNGCEASLRSDRLNCGACGTICQTGASTPSNTCSVSMCRPSCAAGFSDCDGNPANGCETSLSNPLTCGSCMNACGAGLSCTSSGATFACTAACGEPGQSCCGTTACNPGSTCASGLCCRTGQSVCAGACFDLTATVAHCGTCATSCATSLGTTSTACVASTCVPVCAANYGDCDGNPANGCESNLLRTENHCGGCGIACTGLQRCMMGVCSVL